MHPRLAPSNLQHGKTTSVTDNYTGFYKTATTVTNTSKTTRQSGLVLGTLGFTVCHSRAYSFSRKTHAPVLLRQQQHITAVTRTSLDLDFKAPQITERTKLTRLSKNRD